MNIDNMLKSLNEAVEFERGNTQKARIRIIELKPVPRFEGKEVKEIRNKLNLTQNMFAGLMGVSIKTIEAWEAGKNIPNGTAQRMLELLNENPSLIERVIITA